MAEEATTTESEEGSSLRSIADGASLFFAGKVLSNGLGFIFNLILTRVLGATLYGIYTYANTITGFFVVFARLGTGKSLLRFIPSASDDPARQNWVAGLGYLTALLGSVVIGMMLFALAPVINAFTLEEPLLVDVLRILAIVLPFNTLSNLTNSVFRATEQLKYQIIVSNILKPTIRILAVLSAFALGYSLIGAVAALAIGGVLTFGIAISFLYSKTDIHPTGERSRGSFFEFYNFSLPLTLKDLGQKLYTRVDILMVGFFLSGSVVGVYRVSILLATLLTLPLSGINQLFPPIASRLYSNRKIDELESIYQIVTRWVFTAVIPVALVLTVYSSEILRIFGEEFTGDGLVLLFFAIAQLTNCAVGPSGLLLMMTNHQYLNLANQWVLGILNVILNYVFIIEFGFIGAAVATAGTLTTINIVRVIEVWYVEEITPYSKKYWKPVVAGLISIVIMFGWRLFLSGYTLLIVGGSTGTLVFVVVLFFLGIDQDDQEFYEENIRSRIK